VWTGVDQSGLTALFASFGLSLPPTASQPAITHNNHDGAPIRMSNQQQDESHPKRHHHAMSLNILEERAREAVHSNFLQHSLFRRS